MFVSDLLTDRLMEDRGGVSINTVSAEAQRVSDPPVNFQGGCRGQPERAEVSIHAHHKQCTALPTAQRVVSLHRLPI